MLDVTSRASGDMVSGRPLATIVIPTRDRQTLLTRAVGSALAQSVPRIEVIVVDDGSKQPIELDPDARLKIVRHAESRGASAARNSGLAAAEGEWIAFLDDDDELTRDFVEESLVAAENSRLPPPVATLSTVELRHPTGETREVRLPITLSLGESFFAIDDHPQFQGANSLFAPTAVVRSVGGWDENFQSWEVEDFLLRLSRVTSLQGVMKPLYVMHDHPAPRLGENNAAMIDGARRMLAQYPEEFAENRSRTSRYYGALAYLSFLERRPIDALAMAWTSFRLRPRLPSHPLLLARFALSSAVATAAEFLHDKLAGL
jgi:glycosyltransferase involved in cell wall biosynthesis